MLNPKTDIHFPEHVFCCAESGEAVQPKSQMTSDAPTVCAKCRCRHCGIVLSQSVCRCGVRHGSASPIERLCERCYVYLDLNSPVEPTSIMTELMFAAEDVFDEDDDMVYAEDLGEGSDFTQSEDDREEIHTFVA